MGIKKFMCCATVLIVVSSVTVAGQAADKQKDKPTNMNKDKAPIVIEADNLTFSDVTGELAAEGHVLLTKDGETLLTDVMHGNTKQTEVWIDGKATLQQPGTALVGTGTHYNYTSRMGNMEKAVGTVGKTYVSADKMDFSPEKLVTFNGTITKCPAKVPDYHISAGKIEIWPGDKMIAYNAKFWIGNMVIFSLPKYQTSLIQGTASESAFPRIGYNSSDGLMISQLFEYPIKDNIALFADVAYYSHEGFIPVYGVVNRQKNYTLKLSQGKFENGDHDWVKKEPELMLQMTPRRLGKVVGSFTASTGKWTEGNISDSVQDYKLYFNRDPIQFGRIYTLNLGTGLEKTNYGYDNSTNNIWSFNANVTAKPNDRLDLWLGYSYSDESGKSIYEYDKIDVARELTSGFMYKVAQRDSVGIKVDYDLAINKVKDVDYTWKHNLHCWDAAITYRAKRDQWNLKVATAQW